MDMTIFSFTRRGTALGERLRQYGRRRGYVVTAYGLKKYITPAEQARPLTASLAETVGQAFGASQALIFIGAAGIAVRSIAPYIQKKTKDPAVLVIDEKGQFVIPILSGHIGGANELAKELAGFLEAQPVLTTATDVNHVFAVDEWAARHDGVLTSLADAKQFAAALVETKSAGLYSDFPITGTVPPSLKPTSVGPLGVSVALRADCHPFTTNVVVQPRIFHLGMGCRAGISVDAVEDAVRQALDQLAIEPKAIAAVHSIDIKAKEAGIVQFCARHQIPFTTFSAAKLAAVPGYFTASSFVLRTVGVDNVCERAAVCGSGGGTLLLRKTVYDGVTLAVAYEPYTVAFP